MSADTQSEPPPPQPAREPIRINIPPEYYVLPGLGFSIGLTIGLFRGTREASLRYLAENAHRAPTTMRGWYLYKKTKNYRMMLGGLRAGGIEGLRLGATGLGWVTMERGLSKIGLDDVREVGAGIGTAAVFTAVYRAGWATLRRAALLGAVTGATMRTLRFTRGRLAERQGIGRDQELA